MDINTAVVLGQIAAQAFLNQGVPQHVYVGGQYRLCLPYDYQCRTVPPPGAVYATWPPPEQDVPPPARIHPIIPPPSRYAPPPQIHEQTMEQDRERVIEQGEAHCRRWPQDKICHPVDH